MFSPERKGWLICSAHAPEPLNVNTSHSELVFYSAEDYNLFVCVWFSVGSDKLYHQWLSTVRVSTQDPARHPELPLAR